MPQPLPPHLNTYQLTQGREETSIGLLVAPQHMGHLSPQLIFTSRRLWIITRSQELRAKILIQEKILKKSHSSMALRWSLVEQLDKIRILSKLLNPRHPHSSTSNYCNKRQPVAKIDPKPHLEWLLRIHSKCLERDRHQEVIYIIIITMDPLLIMQLWRTTSWFPLFHRPQILQRLL